MAAPSCVRPDRLAATGGAAALSRQLPRAPDDDERGSRGQLMRPSAALSPDTKSDLRSEVERRRRRRGRKVFSPVEETVPPRAKLGAPSPPFFWPRPSCRRPILPFLFATPSLSLQRPQRFPRLSTSSSCRHSSSLALATPPPASHSACLYTIVYPACLSIL